MNDQKNALPKNYLLDNYIIEEILGGGGFGIAYLGRHARIDNLQVVIKEYLPADFAFREADSEVVPKSIKDKDLYQWGLTRFLEEARTLAKFKHENIVRIQDYFEANGTAYFVMPYEAGMTLTEWLQKQDAPPDRDTLLRLFAPVFDGLRTIHARD